MATYALGLDFGTNSVRALLVETATGVEAATAVFDYPSGDEGVYYDANDPNLARQNPLDYIAGIHAATKAVLQASGVSPEDIVGVGVDTTGSSPLPIDANGVPLAAQPNFQNNLDAMCWLWKDHTSFAEAEEITQKAAGYPYLAKIGGTYSSEWFWSKLLRCSRVAPLVFQTAHTWVEMCDFITGYLTGTLPLPKRSICAAGHKAMYSDEWNGLPAAEFLDSLEPALGDLAGRLYSKAYPSDEPAGKITAEVAALTGLKEGTPVAVGAFDAHHGAVGAGIREGTLVKIIGTSTCDCMVHPKAEPIADIPGVCGITMSSVLPDFYGIEAGQSAVGDIFNWFVRYSGQSHEALTAEAEKLQPGESGLLALDWYNGNRTILVDPLLTGLIVGQTLHTTTAETYRALIEATAFGALMIVNRIEEYGVRIDQIINCGGIAERSTLVMQIYADVLNRPMKVSRSAQTCALGAAIFASVVGGAHPNVLAAQAAMTGTKPLVFLPDQERAAVYARLFAQYQLLHDAFGRGAPAPLGQVMKELREIQRFACP
jgi:L-ribulokinase